MIVISIYFVGWNRAEYVVWVKVGVRVRLLRGFRVFFGFFGGIV